MTVKECISVGEKRGKYDAFFSIDDKWRYANVLSALHIISCLISPFYMHFLLALLFASILLHDNRHRRQVLKIGDKMHARE